MSIRWGILGTGRIAADLASDLQYLPDADLVAVGSRRQATADAFGDRFDVPHRHGSYNALVADPDVDVIHVATPHPFHHEHATMALEEGTAVLCEKPLTINAAEAADLIATARANDVFLMEALWTRFLPGMDAVRDAVETELGTICLLEADIGAPTPFDPEHRMFSPELGGGALLDLGIYPIAFAFELLGPPDEVTSSAIIGETGVDEQCAGIFTYDGGAQAIWHASTRADAGRTCAIAGTEGRLEGERAWWKGAPFTLTRSDGSTEVFETPFEGKGYQFEATHVMNCLRADRTESPVMPLDESLRMMETMDAMRAEWGVRYPQEGEGKGKREKR